MKQIRKNVFETNSSSVHSICITKNSLLDNLKKHIDLKLGYYGWSEELFKNPDDKASYLYTALCLNDETELILMIADTLKKHKISYTFQNPDDLDKYSDYYIDHVEELLGVFKEICQNEQMLLRFLFSSESFIITGNDNYENHIVIRPTYPHDIIEKRN